MEKGQMSSSGPSGATAPEATAPLPSAPPSYEEAVGLPLGGISMPMPGMTGMAPVPAGVPGAPPYPVMGTPMPMPTPHGVPTAAQIPAHTTNRPVEVRVVHQHVSLGPNPVKMSCPSCHADIKTTTMSDHQPSAHVCCIILCLLGCCLCSCLPYCLSAFLSVHHFCPNCKAYIGTWKG
ncbi:lipopolysaccharide-induced tumor necrosis factor-alpha factor homolog [Nasonia vitripennis]|uniref:LITAF domain-containing protein n=1 Tax=Nasonia vitripennis TaxID=7425 RepID=A0A7M7GBM5_NASVI|nr:lipopolysaccharide-induced tumor necrosis factor-alpha factor homolog [Nasonia vitripennis]